MYMHTQRCMCPNLYFIYVDASTCMWASVTALEGSKGNGGASESALEGMEGHCRAWKGTGGTEGQGTGGHRRAVKGADGFYQFPFLFKQFQLQIPTF